FYQERKIKPRRFDDAARLSMLLLSNFFDWRIALMVVMAGVEQKAHYFVMDLPQSDDCFVAAFPAETTEAFLEAHVRAFDYFGGVPGCIVYDNTNIAVAKILGD